MPAAVAIGLAVDAVGGGDRGQHCGGAPAGARAVRPSVASVACAIGAGAGALGSGASTPPPGSACGVAAGARASAAAQAPRAHGFFTVSELLVVSFRRFRGELTGSRWKELRYAGLRRRFAPNCRGSPGRPERIPGGSAITYEASELRTDEKVSAGAGSSVFGGPALDARGRVRRVLVERLVAQQRLGERVELLAVLGEQPRDLAWDSSTIRRTSSSTSRWVSSDASRDAGQQRALLVGGQHRDRADRRGSCPSGRPCGARSR